MTRTLAGAILLGSLLLPLGLPAGETTQPAHPRNHDNLKRAKVYLAAADYRRAVEACLREVDEAPSVESYVYLTYVYQALDGYLEYLAKEDKWVAVEQLYRSLLFGGPQDLADQPDVLARIAKEMIQQSAQQQSDVNAAMAAKLNADKVAQLWKQQTAWRQARRDDWFLGVPAEWQW